MLLLFCFIIKWTVPLLFYYQLDFSVPPVPLTFYNQPGSFNVCFIIKWTVLFLVRVIINWAVLCLLCFIVNWIALYILCCNITWTSVFPLKHYSVGWTSLFHTRNWVAPNSSSINSTPPRQFCSMKDRQRCSFKTPLLLILTVLVNYWLDPFR